MFKIIENSKLKVPHLTPEERKWVYRMKRCLEACPERLEFMTEGDQLSVVDRTGASNSELHSGHAYDDGVVLASMPGPKCHGVC
ncbi:MAG: hypothetical protein WC919_04145 [Candidatus Paceibacterota bacterium]|jgi:hypothetical protein